MLSVTKNPFTLRVLMLNGIVLSAVMLNVVLPTQQIIMRLWVQVQLSFSTGRLRNVHSTHGPILKLFTVEITTVVVVTIVKVL